MGFDIIRAAGVDGDLERIFDFLIGAAEGFGESPESAFAMAEQRLLQIERNMLDLARAPYQGTLHPALGPDIRHVTKDRAIYYFDVDAKRGLVRVLAVFFGGQDHDAGILLRLLWGE